MTEEKVKQVENAVADFIIRICYEGTLSSNEIDILPEMVHEYTELLKLKNTEFEAESSIQELTDKVIQNIEEDMSKLNI